jgi:hypothetical protein
MYSINIDESTIHVFIAARPSRLYVLHSWTLERLLDHLDNRRKTHNFQYGALEWARGNRNDAHYCSVVMLHGL